MNGKGAVHGSSERTMFPLSIHPKKSAPPPRGTIGPLSGTVQESFRNLSESSGYSTSPNSEHFEMLSKVITEDVHLYDEHSTSLRATKKGCNVDCSIGCK